MTLAEMAEIMKEEMPDVWNNEAHIVSNPLRQFLVAFSSMKEVTDDYCLDSGVSVVSSFLGASKSWNTSRSKEIKEELRRRLEENNKHLSSLNAQGGNSLF